MFSHSSPLPLFLSFKFASIIIWTIIVPYDFLIYSFFRLSPLSSTLFIYTFHQYYKYVIFYYIDHIQYLNFSYYPIYIHNVFQNISLLSLSYCLSHCVEQVPQMFQITLLIDTLFICVIIVSICNKCFRKAHGYIPDLFETAEPIEYASGAQTANSWIRQILSTMSW